MFNYISSRNCGLYSGFTGTPVQIAGVGAESFLVSKNLTLRLASRKTVEETDWMIFPPQKNTYNFHIIKERLNPKSYGI